jgi:hypothetical protein
MDKIVSEEIFSNRLKGVCHPLYDEIHQEVCVKMNSPFGVYNAPEHELLFRNSLYLQEISELFGILRAEHPLY